MKLFKKLSVILAVAAASAVACVLAACGGNGYINGTFTDELSNDDIMASENETILLAYLGVGTPHGSVELGLSDDGTYKLTKYLTACDDPNFAFGEGQDPVIFEFVYTGNYEKGDGANAYDLKFPTDCEWSFDSGIYATMGTFTVESGSGKYSEGDESFTISTSFGEGDTFEVMELFPTQYISVSELPEDTSTFVQTVTVDTENGTLVY